MNKLLLSVLLITRITFAGAQLVNDHRFIPLKEGQLFSINEDNKKYKFHHINFELELINNTIDFKHIKQITFYSGNSALALGKSSLICGIVAGLTASRGNTPPKEVITNIGIYVVPMSIIGFSIGYFLPEKKIYIISENDWKFIP